MSADEHPAASSDPDSPEAFEGTLMDGLENEPPYPSREQDAATSHFTLKSLEGRFSELAIAANQVLIGLRPIKSNGEYVNRFYGREIERLDALVKEVLGDARAAE